MSHHKTGQEVLLCPKSRVERKVRVGFAAASILWRGGHGPGVVPAITAIVFNSQSWSKKLERIRAELLLSNMREFSTDQTLREMGLRKAICVCGPGVGHNAVEPPNPPR